MLLDSVRKNYSLVLSHKRKKKCPLPWEGIRLSQPWKRGIPARLMEEGVGSMLIKKPNATEVF